MGENKMDTDLTTGNGYSTTSGISMKQGQKQIVTGMDKLVNPKGMTQSDTIFDSSPSRDINAGSVNDEGGIDYKALKAGNPLKG